MAFLVLVASIVLNTCPQGSSRLDAGDDGKSRASDRLDALLKAWDRANQNARALHYTMDSTTEDVVLKNKEVCRLEGFINKPRLERVDIRDEKGKLTHILLLLNDKTLEWYDMQNEQKRVSEISPGFPEKYFDQGWLMGLLARSFQWNRQLLCFEYAVGEIRERFDVRLNKEDKYWAYIQLEPKAKEIRAELRDMEVVLDQKTHFVRQYRLVYTNGNRTIMDFQKIEINPIPPITLESISKGLPKGFKEIYIPIS
jgi:outer membrane lipoprotein-sorting protein